MSSRATWVLFPVLLTGCLGSAEQEDSSAAENMVGVYEIDAPLTAPEPGEHDGAGNLLVSPVIQGDFSSGQHRYHKYVVETGAPLVRVVIDADFAPALMVRTRTWQVTDDWGKTNKLERSEWARLLPVPGSPSAYQAVFVRDRDQPLDLYVTSLAVQQGARAVSPNAHYRIQLINFEAVRSFCAHVQTENRWSGEESDLFDHDPNTTYELAYGSKGTLILNLHDCQDPSSVATVFLTEAQLRVSSRTDRTPSLHSLAVDPRIPPTAGSDRHEVSQSLKWLRPEGDDFVATYRTAETTYTLWWTFGDDENTDFLWTYEDAEIRDITLTGVTMDDLHALDAHDLRGRGPEGDVAQ